MTVEYMINKEKKLIIEQFWLKTKEDEYISRTAKTEKLI